MIGGAMHGRTRARNCPVERPTHATVWALGVVCANASWAPSPNPIAWRGPRAPRHGGGHCAGPHTPIGQVLVAAARRGSRCEGEARELTTRQCTASSAIRPRHAGSRAGTDGGGIKRRNILKIA